MGERDRDVRSIGAPVKRWALIGVGASAYAAALVVTAPATLVDAALSDASQGRLRLTQAQGTVWSGSGFVELRDARQRTGVAKRVAWEVAPLAFLRGQLALEAVTSDRTLPFAVTATRSRVEIGNAALTVPAAILGLAVPKLAPLGLTGELTLTIPRFAIAHGGASGHASAQWVAAGSALSKVSPLGAYELTLEPSGTALQATLRTLRGPLELDGSGVWTIGTMGTIGTNGNGAGFRGRARVAPAQREALAPLLRLVAVERGEGAFDFELR